MIPPTALLDIDGTLVDSNYQHALAWYRAFRLHGITIPVWRCHRAIGMGGDQLVSHLAGEGFECEHGDTVRTEEQALYAQMIGEVQAFEGARGLIEDLKRGGGRIVVVSSAKPEDTQRYLDLLDARDLVDGSTDSGSVDATKPAPDLVEAALELAGAGPKTARPRRPPRSGRSRCAPAASAPRSCATPARSQCTTRSANCASSSPTRHSGSPCTRSTTKEAEVRPCEAGSGRATLRSQRTRVKLETVPTDAHEILINVSP